MIISTSVLCGQKKKYKKTLPLNLKKKENNLLSQGQTYRRSCYRYQNYIATLLFFVKLFQVENGQTFQNLQLNNVLHTCIC